MTRTLRPRKTAFVWTAQVLLAVLFLFAGATKFTLPTEVLQQGPIALPLAFIRFIGASEILGGLGLILPGLLRVKVALTPWAAVGLVAIMTGATVITIEGGMFTGAILPLVVGILATWIAVERAAWARLPLWS